MTADELRASNPRQFGAEMRKRDQPNYLELVKAKGEARARKWAKYKARRKD